MDSERVIVTCWNRNGFWTAREWCILQTYTLLDISRDLGGKHTLFTARSRSTATHFGSLLSQTRWTSLNPLVHHFPSRARGSIPPFSGHKRQIVRISHGYIMFPFYPHDSWLNPLCFLLKSKKNLGKTQKNHGESTKSPPTKILVHGVCSMFPLNA